METLEPLEVNVLGVPAKVRTSYGVRGEEILRACREGTNAPAREAPRAPVATQRLAPADIRDSVVSLCSHLLTIGLRAIGHDYRDCERGSSNLCETSRTSSTRTEPGRTGAAL